MKTTGTNPDITILFEDNHLLAVDKPAGVLSQEDYTGRPDLLNLCKSYIKREYNKPGNVYLGLLHRLDKPVSGVMVFAKTSKSASRISEQIRQRRINKTYAAITEGKPQGQQMLSHHLLKDSSKNLSKVTHGNHKKAKKAELIYTVTKTKNNLSLLSVRLITGRAHQIRVQLSHEGFPIWGDKKYGSSYIGNIALHASELTLEHPTLKKELSFKSDLPIHHPWDIFHTR